MRTLAVFLVLAPLAAPAGDCPSDVWARVYSNQDIHLQSSLDGAPATALKVRLYTADRLLRDATTDGEGSLKFGVLAAGRYRLSIPDRAVSILEVREGRGLNAPTIFWNFPRAKVATVNGKKVKTPDCPYVVEVSN